MNPPLRLRNLTRADLPFADAVRALAGWNQTPADWERMLALEPDGCFLAEWQGAPAGTATTTVYSPKLAWIGMVLVHPDFRRRGIGRALLQRCLEYLGGRGVDGIKLDATPEGRGIYSGLGFKDEWTLTRWQRAGVVWSATEPNPHVREWRPGDLIALGDLDAAAFGVPRLALLRKLAEESHRGMIWESEGGQIEGYGWLRDGSYARYLGPVAAVSKEVAFAIVDRLIGQDNIGGIIGDIPDRNLAATAWARRHGFTPHRSLTRMCLGENLGAGDPQKQFAIAGPELG